MSAIELVEKSQMTERPDMKSGDTVRVHVKVREGDKERIQIFEGIVIGMHRGGTRSTSAARSMTATAHVSPVSATARRITAASPTTRQPSASGPRNNRARISGPIPQASPIVSASNGKESAFTSTLWRLAAPAVAVRNAPSMFGTRRP